MIHHDVIQGTSEWLQLRAGIPTASQFHKIITPKTRRLSAQADHYIYKLLAEKLLGRYLEETRSFFWAERGKELEAEARAFYEALRNVETTQIGFITNDDRTVGASPDRLVGEDGLLEIKCPAPDTHMAYYLDEPVTADYWLQIQGQLWVSEREWSDVFSYCPGLPPALHRVSRDETTIAMLEDVIGQLVVRLDGLAEDMRARMGGESAPLKVLAG